MRKTLLIALCFFCMNVLAVTEKVTVWKASALDSSGSEHVQGLKNADGSDGSDAFQCSNGNFYFNTGVEPTWGWDRYMTIAPAAFAKIDMQEGDLLNVVLTYTKASQIALKQADATKFDACTLIASSSSVSSGSYSLKLTSSIISQIKSKGLAIGGLNLNWNEVYISPKGSTPPITLLDKPGFHTDGVRLLDANGKEFLMRGYNYSYAWQKNYWDAAFKTAKKYNCNALRIQLSDGQNSSLGGYCKAEQVSSLISSCKDNHFIGVFNVQDTGGGNDPNVLLHAADYWVGIKNAVIGQEKYCIVNIGNEWMESPGRDCNGEWGEYQENLWSNTYIEAVRRIRSAGIKNTLMIDCNGYGQYADIIWKEGQRILDEDKKYFEDGKPNIIFSIHFYEKACYWDYEKGTGSRVAHSIDKALSIGAPVCIGEYAYSRKSEKWKMDWETIQDYSKTMNIGYLGWSFTGNGDEESQGLDMFSYDGSTMYENGKCIILHPNDGIKATSVICSVYEGGAESHITERYVSGGEASADVQPYLKDAKGQALDYVKLNIPEESLKLNKKPGLTLTGADLKRAGALEGRFFRIILKPGKTISGNGEAELNGAAYAATANITYGNLQIGDRSLSEWKYIDLPCDGNSAALTIKGSDCTLEGIYLMKPEYLYKAGQAETELKATYSLDSDYKYNTKNQWGPELLVPGDFFKDVQEGWSMVLSYKDASGQISVKDGAYYDATTAVEGSYYVWLKGYDSYNGTVDYSSISGSGTMSIALGDKASKFSDYKTYTGTATGMLASLKTNGLCINGHDWTLTGIQLYGPKATVASNSLTGCIEFKRNLKASCWKAMSLPYNLSKEQTEDLFPSAKITTLSKVETSKDNTQQLIISFDNVDHIEANKPYLIKVASDLSAFSLCGVANDVTKFQSETITVKESSDPKTSVSLVSTCPTSESEMSSIPLNAYYLRDGVFYPNTNKDRKIKAGLCYMTIQTQTGSPNAKSFSIKYDGEEEGDISTGIHEIQTSQAASRSEAIYTLQGVRVQHPGKGIYIVNGKKILF